MSFKNDNFLISHIQFSGSAGCITTFTPPHRSLLLVSLTDLSSSIWNLIQNYILDEKLSQLTLLQVSQLLYTVVINLHLALIINM